MPKAVRRALQAAAVTQGGLSESEAASLFQQLEATGRLQCETW